MILKSWEWKGLSLNLEPWKNQSKSWESPWICFWKKVRILQYTYSFSPSASSTFQSLSFLPLISPHLSFLSSHSRSPTFLSLFAIFLSKTPFHTNAWFQETDIASSVRRILRFCIYHLTNAVFFLSGRMIWTLKKQKCISPSLRRPV